MLHLHVGDEVRTGRRVDEGGIGRERCGWREDGLEIFVGHRNSCNCLLSHRERLGDDRSNALPDKAGTIGSRRRWSLGLSDWCSCRAEE